MSWEKLPAWTETVPIGCPNCSPVPDNTPTCRLDRFLAVGFGSVTVSKDGMPLYDEQEWAYRHPEEDIPTLAAFEARASGDPDHDWRVQFYAPLHEEEYQRQGEGL